MTMKTTSQQQQFHNQPATNEGDNAITSMMTTPVTITMTMLPSP